MGELKKTKELVEKYLKKKYPNAQFTDEDLEFLARFSVKKEPKESKILKELGLIGGKGTVQGYYADHESVKNAKDCIQAIYERFNTKRNSQKKKEHPVDVFGDDFEAFFAWWCKKTPEDGIRHCCYCGIDEKTLKKAFKNGVVISKKPSFSGELQIERKNPNRDYCADNCEFACVICNNAKSDMISAEDFKKFFVPGIKEYWKHKVISMVYLSKSKYCGLWQCPKIAWMKKYKPEELTLDKSVLSRMEAGNEVGDLAMGLFGDYVEVTAYNNEKLDLSKMMERTKAEMQKGTPVICEASFEYNGLYCAVDILKKEGDGWAIYEVKSSTKHENSTDDKPVYIADVAYQKYVLENCGIKLSGTYLVCLNGDYIFDGTLDIDRLFTISDIAEAVAIEEKNITANLSVAERLLNSPAEPDIDLSVGCKNPYLCGFWNYCSKHIPKQSVFNLYRMWFSKKIAFYKKGLVTYSELLNSSEITNKTQLRQMEFALQDKGTYIEKENIRDFLSSLSYPLYFLDFETMQPVIPKYVGTKPYAQIPFQYSLHYIGTEGGELKHKEFLAESGTDPRRRLAEQLCADIPMNVCVTAYNKAFECTRLKELAEAFPDLAEHLLNIRDNIVDLLVPFQSGYYYNRAMGGSFSIKSVLPAIFPDDPELDYHNLDGVHNGGEAMTIFPKIQFMSPEEQKIARHNLLKYCELDTYAMVKVWEELVRAAE